MFNNPSEFPDTGKIENIEKKEINFSQQDKIISFFANNKDLKVLEEKSTLPKGVDEEKFLRDVAGGVIKNKDFEELLEKIMPPIMKNGEVEKNVEILFEKISKNKQMKSFIAHLLFGNFQRRNNLKANDLVDFCRKYSNPISFEENISGFMDEIKELNSDDKYKQYIKAKKEFIKIIYGKRSEYYNQINLLKEDSNNRFPKLAEANKEKESLKKALEEDNNVVVENILRKEFERILGILKKNGVISNNLDFLSDEYLSLRKESPIIKIMLDEIKGNLEHPFSEIFLKLEKEVLQEFLDKK